MNLGSQAKARTALVSNLGWPPNTRVFNSSQFGVRHPVRAGFSSAELGLCWLAARFRGEAGESSPIGTTLGGLVIPYGQPSTAAWMDCLEFKDGAFTRGLMGNPDISVTHDGQAARIIGRTRSGTARVWEDSLGLHFEANPPVGASWADDLLVSVGRRDVTSAWVQCSASGKTVKRGSKQVTVIERADVLQLAVTPFSLFDAGLAITRPGETASAERKELERLYRK